MAKTEAKNLARELFFHTDKTQKEIASMVGVSTRSMNDWATEGNWSALKQIERVTPEKAIQDLYKELDQVNTLVKSRADGERFASAKEADARRKIVATIRDLERQVALPQYVQVCIELMEFVKEADLELAQKVNPQVNEFLMVKAAHVTK